MQSIGRGRRHFRRVAASFCCCRRAQATCLLFFRSARLFNARVALKCTVSAGLQAESGAPLSCGNLFAQIEINFHQACWLLSRSFS